MGADAWHGVLDEAEGRGWAVRAAALGAGELADVEADLAGLAAEPLEPQVGPVRQAGAAAVAPVAGRPAVEALAGRLAGSGWWPDELAVMVYGPGEGISPHRDNGFYAGFVAVVTLWGTGRFRVVADRAGHDVLDDREVGPGDLVVLRGPRPGPGDARPLHAVSAGPGGRRSLTLRRNSRGAGRGWS